MNLLAGICCSGLIAFLNFNLIYPLERTFSKPIYTIKSLAFKQGVLGAQIKPADKYTIILVGDSMTQALGAGETMMPVFRKIYPKREIHILNYGIGSTSILTLPDRLTKGAIRGSETLLPILSHNFDAILIESFGNNPLSGYELKEGLKKQTAILDESIKLIKENKPNAIIIFVATIAPNKERYAEGVVNLNPKQRKEWAEERMAYIKNHIEYAKTHHILLIDVFNKSLVNGEANIDLVNDSDFIHPSNTGLILIGGEIADFIIKKRILPL